MGRGTPYRTPGQRYAQKVLRGVKMASARDRAALRWGHANVYHLLAPDKNQRTQDHVCVLCRSPAAKEAVMFTPDERATIIEVTAADPAYMVDLLSTALYDQSVDVTAVQEARLLMAELAALTATQLDEGTRARIARFMEETK